MIIYNAWTHWGEYKGEWQSVRAPLACSLFEGICDDCKDDDDDNNKM